jgi:hypothetical protein
LVSFPSIDNLVTSGAFTAHYDFPLVDIGAKIWLMLELKFSIFSVYMGLPDLQPVLIKAKVPGLIKTNLFTRCNVLHLDS